MYDDVGRRTSIMATDRSGRKVDVCTQGDTLSQPARRGSLQVTEAEVRKLGGFTVVGAGRRRGS